MQFSWSERRDTLFALSHSNWQSKKNDAIILHEEELSRASDKIGGRVSDIKTSPRLDMPY